MESGANQSLKSCPLFTASLKSNSAVAETSSLKKSRKIFRRSPASSSSPMEDNFARCVVISVPTRAK